MVVLYSALSSREGSTIESRKTFGEAKKDELVPKASSQLSNDF